MALSDYRIWMIWWTIAVWIFVTTSVYAQSKLPAFPGAEGFGASASGGRGGRVIKVTNLNPSGPGSLQDAVSQSGPRIVIFDVSGKIPGNVTIYHGDLTIAGQTAPGGGITIRGQLYSRYKKGIDNIIIRHLRIRPLMYNPSLGSGEGYDAIQFSKNHRLILDHISVSWGVDETVDFYNAKDVTIQWSTIEESATVGHPKGLHNYGLLNIASRISVHHNLFAHHKNRSPAIASGPAEVINNIGYDIKDGFHHHNPARGPFNIIGNYYKRGPSSRLVPFSLDYEGPPDLSLAYFFKDNYIDDPGDYVGVVDNPWITPFLHSSFLKNMRGRQFRAYKAFDFTRLRAEYFPVNIQNSKDIFNLILNKAGSFPRDVVTLRTIDEVRKRKGSWGVKEPKDIMAGLRSTSSTKDSDNDGMPDLWELKHNLNPEKGKDHNKTMPSGYTAIEEYINEMADNLVGGIPETAPKKSSPIDTKATGATPFSDLPLILKK